MKSPRRPAYTLLEVLLASAIGALLLGALYVALKVQLDLAQTGRDVVEQSTLARSLLNRMATDIRHSLGPLDQGRLSTQSQGGNQNQGGGQAQGGGQSQGGGQAQGGGQDQAAAQQTTTAPPPITYNLGLTGTQDTLILYVGRGPRDLGPAGGAADGRPQPGTTDLRRVTYQLGNGNEETGLYRQEVILVQADDGSGELVPAEEAPFQLLAEEVRGLRFRYCDPNGGDAGGAWVENWPDQAVTPQDLASTLLVGPPTAVEITLEIAEPNPPPGQEAAVRTYRLVVAVPTANGRYQATTTGGNAP